MWFARFSVNGSFHQPFSVLINRRELLVNHSHRLTGNDEKTEYGCIISSKMDW
jgi:hypothetical protein